MEEAARGKPEQEFGQKDQPGYKFYPAVEPDWRVVSEQALSLASRTRDLRIAVTLARAGARQQGIQAYAEALALISGMLDRHWDHVHPMLDSEDDNDPTMRVNALLPLVHSATGLADLRSAKLGALRPPLTVRHVELAAGKATPNDGEPVPTQAGVAQALAEAQQKTPGLLEAMQLAHAEFKRIEATLESKLKASASPNLRPLATILACVAATAVQAQGGAAVPAGADAPAADEPSMPSRGNGDLRSRDDVVRALERACDWIEHNEPANPAPLLIRRAQRLMNKSFLDIIRDLAPAGLDEVEKIAGSAGS